MRYRILSLPVFLVVFVGCGPAYTVSDGTYIMEMHEGARTPTGQRIEYEVQLQIGSDGRIVFLDESGRRTHTHGKLRGNEVELTYRFEGLLMEGTGRVTAQNRMEGTCTLAFLDVGLHKSRVIKKEASWSLVKKE